MILSAEMVRPMKGFLKPWQRHIQNPFVSIHPNFFLGRLTNEINLVTAVYSPRRFPGMLEPTELSKKLASQGKKIDMVFLLYGQKLIFK